jgi:hypothetical protein
MIWRMRAVILTIAALALAGCTGERVWAPDDQVTAAAYRPAGPASVTLITVLITETGGGLHSALLIDGEQRVMFDPAGSWYNPDIPERNDVLYGMTDPYLDNYYDLYASDRGHVVLQRVEIPPATAAHLIDAVHQVGAVPRAQCSLSISRVLSRTPGFESIRPSFFPPTTMRRFAEIEGVQTTTIYDDDSDDELERLRAEARARVRQQIFANSNRE